MSRRTLFTQVARTNRRLILGRRLIARLALLSISLATAAAVRAQERIPAPGSLLEPASQNITITADDVTVEKVGTSIPVGLIGEPVSAVNLSPPQWNGDGNGGGYASVDGQIMPVDSEAPAINFRVMLPGSWSRRSAQMGGAGMNGTIPGLNGREFNQGLVTYGSDSGHQAGGFGGGGRRGGAPGARGGRGGLPGARRGGAGGPVGAGQVATQGDDGPSTDATQVPAGPPAGPRGAQGGLQRGVGGRGAFGGQAGPGRGGLGGRGGFGGGGGGAGNAWATNDEAIKNLGYMQMKKTHDAAMVIIERVYGERPRFNYYFGGSQGGREALMVAQRYPKDYDGIVADVPIVGFSSLMLSPARIRIQEKPLEKWVTPSKVNAIRAEFLRQTDGLDGLKDGIIYNYAAARRLFDMSQGDPNRNPWAALRGPDGKDPNPDDASVEAKLSDGQIDTLKMVYSKYKFATPVANDITSFGMWLPTTDPRGSNLIVNGRFRGQEGAAEDAPLYGWLGSPGVAPMLMRDVNANPLDYQEGGPLNDRRIELSGWLDALNPDLSEFYKRGGKMIVTIGAQDGLASPGMQMDYYQSLHDKMGPEMLDAFARLFVIPQGGHGLSGSSANVNGKGESIPVTQIPSQFDRRGLLMAWVERNEVPDKTQIGRAGNRTQLICTFPNYPKYVGGPPESHESYQSTAP